MDERDFYTQSETTRPSTLICPRCGQSAEYHLKWQVWLKRDQLPGSKDERDRAKFQWLQSYMVLSDDGVTCQNVRCLKYIPISGIKTMVFL